MAAHSSMLAWRTPWTEEAGRLQSMEGGQIQLGKQQIFCLFMFFGPKDS